MSPALGSHEDQDERPSQVALQPDIVDEIGGGAQDEKPAPDDEIDLERVMLVQAVIIFDGDLLSGVTQCFIIKFPCVP